MSDKTRLLVLASGSGSNLQAIINACAKNILPAEVVAVFSDNQNAYALERGREAKISTFIHSWKLSKADGKSREEYDAELAEAIKSFHPDLIVLAGWMRLLSMSFLSHFPMKVINLHPALPGCFPGTHAIEKAFTAYQYGEIKETGVMVHFVPDEGIDNGPLILKQIIPINEEDSLELLSNRIHQVEHELLVKAINTVINSKKLI